MKVLTINNLSVKTQVVRYVILTVALFVIANGYSQNTIRIDNRKIILIATLNNTYQNFIKDTLFQIDSCLKLRFDTISLSQLKKPETVNGIKSSSDFVYNGIYCTNNQLFDVNKKIDIKQYHIKSFSIIATFGPVWLTPPINKGACFDDYIRNIFCDYIQTFYKRRNSKVDKIWLNGIKVTSDDGVPFCVNEIKIEISK